MVPESLKMASGPVQNASCVSLPGTAFFEKWPLLGDLLFWNLVTILMPFII